MPFVKGNMVDLSDAAPTDDVFHSQWRCCIQCMNEDYGSFDPRLATEKVDER